MTELSGKMYFESQGASLARPLQSVPILDVFFSQKGRVRSLVDGSGQASRISGVCDGVGMILAESDYAINQESPWSTGSLSQRLSM